MNKGWIAQWLIVFAKSLLSFLPVGLAYFNILAYMLFGATSGSAVAAASAIGGFITFLIEKEGYPNRLVLRRTSEVPQLV
ncbi:MAG: TRAP transporter large permease subunit [Bacteroidota bacterium]